LKASHRKEEAARWTEAARRCIMRRDSSVAHIVGVGNPIREDDSVGLYVVGQLKRRVGARPRPSVRIHGESLAIERVLTRIDCTVDRLLLVDAVDAGKEPGYVLCANIEDTRYGYFATHNIPLRLIPTVAGGLGNVFIVGIQPARMGVGEGLSEVVRDSAEQVVDAMEEIIGGSDIGTG
jgi:hydrogenase maturation protease